METLTQYSCQENPLNRGACVLQSMRPKDGHVIQPSRAHTHLPVTSSYTKRNENAIIIFRAALFHNRLKNQNIQLGPLAEIRNKLLTHKINELLSKYLMLL